MPDQLQLRGGTTTEHNSFTGAAREVTVDTTKKTLVVHDGSQAGGTPLMKESGATAATTVQIGTGGVERFKITNGEVVFNETSTDTDFRIEGNGDANLFKVDAGNDRIGVGVATPASTFHVHGDGTLRLSPAAGANQAESGRIRFTENITDFQGAYIHYDGNANKLHIGTHNGNTTDAANDIDCLTILRGGTSIGLGTDDPQTQIHAKKAGGCVIRLEDSTDNNYSHIFNSSDDLFISADRNGTGAGNLIFRNGGTTERMRIQSDGDVGIGTSSPDGLLHMKNNNAFDTKVIIESTGTNSYPTYSLKNDARQYSLQINGANDSFRVYDTTATAERITLSTSGKVGIGTTSPVGILHVHKADSGTVDGLMITNTSTTNNGLTIGVNSTEQPFFWNGSNTSMLFATNNTERIRIASDGKIAIGNSATDTGGVVIDKNITAESDASDTANYHLVIRSQSNSNSSKVGIAFKNTTSATSVGAAILHHRTSGGSIGDLAFYTSGSEGNTTERIKITSAGTLLHGSGAIATPKATTGGVDVSANNLSIVFGADSNSGVATQTRTNNAPKDQRIAAIHYTNAEEPIGVVRVYSDSTTNQMHFGGGSSLFNAATTMYFYTAATNTTTNGSERMRINSAGSVSMGTTTNANARLFVNPRVDGTTQRGIVVSGRKDVYDVIAINFVHAVNNSSAGSIQFTSTAAVQYNTTSDYRLKQDVVTLTDSITRLKLLNPVHFKWKDSPSVETDGFLAHEVQTVIPSAITGEKDALDKDGNIEPQQIDTSKLTPLLTSALQEAIAKIETLETKVAALEAA